MNQERIYKVILGPHVSEKASMSSESGSVVFKVSPDANKIEIKQAVESLFKVNVKKVTVVNIKGKTKRTSHGLGRRNSVRKAYVRLSEGQEIDFVDVE